MLHSPASFLPLFSLARFASKADSVLCLNLPGDRLLPGITAFMRDEICELAPETVSLHLCVPAQAINLPSLDRCMGIILCSPKGPTKRWCR